LSDLPVQEPRQPGWNASQGYLLAPRASDPGPSLIAIDASRIAGARRSQSTRTPGESTVPHRQVTIALEFMLDQRPSRHQGMP
jgi:hypothetical protein